RPGLRCGLLSPNPEPGGRQQSSMGGHLLVDGTIRFTRHTRIIIRGRTRGKTLLLEGVEVASVGDANDVEGVPVLGDREEVLSRGVPLPSEWERERPGVRCVLGETKNVGRRPTRHGDIVRDGPPWWKGGP